MSEDDKSAQAGGIAHEVLEATLKKGREGAKPAFPINISINDRAAHYTPEVDDASVFKQGDLVKIDIGVHVDGYIGDIARSVAIGGGHKELITAAEAALENAINAIKPGAMSNEIGGIVEETIKGFGFLPVSNL